ncbi:MAG: putative CRISPR-associated protein [Verrucomicrobia bacterium]|nr:putative CRISPR-associated protein [Verrucomicrobiota bacterium]
MINTLLCTVGTSLFGNLQRLQPDQSPIPAAAGLKQAFVAGDWQRLGHELATVPPSDSLCGAELNTLDQLRRRADLALHRLTLLVSDTDDGRHTGEVLRRYLVQRRDFELDEPEIEVVSGLQDQHPRDFKNHGLRNLVRLMGKHIQQAGGPNLVAIDATGGYKAQIAVAVVLGQALGIPVFYKHERFSETIAFPPLPISLDYALLGQHADLLAALERNATLSEADLSDTDPRLLVLLNEECVDGTRLYELSAIGQIYLTGFRVSRGRSLQLVPAQSRKAPTFGNDHHFPDGFKEAVLKVWRENDFIETCHSLPNAHGGRPGLTFRVAPEKNQLTLIGTYGWNNWFPRFAILLEGMSTDVLTLAADRLNQKYGG